MAKSYKHLGVHSRLGCQTSNLHDYWIIGDRIAFSLLSDQLLSIINSFYSQDSIGDGFDPTLFTKKALLDGGSARLVIVQSQAMSESLRRHVLNYSHQSSRAVVI